MIMIIIIKIIMPTLGQFWVEAFQRHKDSSTATIINNQGTFPRRPGSNNVCQLKMIVSNTHIINPQMGIVLGMEKLLNLASIDLVFLINH